MAAKTSLQKPKIWGVNLERKRGVNLLRKQGGQIGAEKGGQYQRIFHHQSGNCVYEYRVHIWDHT